MPGSRCVVKYCSNDYSKKGVSLHSSPISGQKRAEWVKFVRTHRKNFSPNSRFVVCSVHFEKDCFLRPRDSRLKIQLKPGAVPTIWKERNGTAVNSSREKRQKAKVSCVISMAQQTACMLHVLVPWKRFSLQSFLSSSYANLFQCKVYTHIQNYLLQISSKKSAVSACEFNVFGLCAETPAVARIVTFRRWTSYYVCCFSLIHLHV